MLNQSPMATQLVHAVCALHLGPLILSMLDYRGSIMHCLNTVLLLAFATSGP